MKKDGLSIIPSSLPNWLVLMLSVLPVWFILFCSVFISTAKGAEGFRFAEATGRAVIMHEAATDEARMIALEDALYQVALQGGAEVNGFSAVTSDTTLSDHFVGNGIIKNTTRWAHNEMIAQGLSLIHI